LEQIKITRRDQQVLNLLIQGCSNKDAVIKRLGRS
jgi:DNA-binding NarL/FixJ family response regulator